MNGLAPKNLSVVQMAIAAYQCTKRHKVGYHREFKFSLNFSHVRDMAGIIVLQSLPDSKFNIPPYLPPTGRFRNQ